MTNVQQTSPMEQLRAFGIVFVAGMLTTAAIGLAAKVQTMLDKN